MATSKEILLQELEEQSHPVNVEEVIFKALEYYSESKGEQTWEKIIAYSIKQRILDAGCYPSKETCDHDY